jgi:hypothetical protein
MDHQGKLTWGKEKHDLLDRWPKDAAGELEAPALLTELQDAGGIADMIVAQMEAYKIPVLKKYTGESALGRVVLGFSGYGVSLYVPASRLEEAQDLLSAAEDVDEAQK